MLNPNRRQAPNPFQFSNEITDRNHSFNNRESINSGIWPPKPAQNHRNYRSRNDTELQFGTEQKEVEDSGICSPPLWRASPPRSPQNRKNYYRSLSPESKTEAIARGQMELMEMVRNMPESTFELTLKDLVEQPKTEAREEITTTERNLKNKNMRREGSNRTMGKRNGNIDSGGFYLKLVFPTFLGSKNKKKNEYLANNSSRVSPRPSVSDGSVKGGADNKEWWKKDASVCVESDSGVSSINSGSMKSSGSSSSGSSSRNNSRYVLKI